MADISPAEAVGRAIADANNQLWSAMPESLREEFRKFGGVAIKAYLDTVSARGIATVISGENPGVPYAKCRQTARLVIGTMRVL